MDAATREIQQECIALLQSLAASETDEGGKGYSLGMIARLQDRPSEATEAYRDQLRAAAAKRGILSFNEFDADPVVGEVVSGRSYGPGYSTRWSGTYQGVVTSEWDGEPMHFFTDGIIGTTPQSCFGHPAPGEALTTDLSPSQIMAALATEATQ